MILASDELRLVYAILLNAIVLAAAWRFARSIAENFLDAAIDAGVIYYLVQYVTIGGLGIVGLLTPVAIAIVAVGVSVCLWVAAKPQATAMLAPRVVSNVLDYETPVAVPRLERAMMVAAFFFVVGYAGALCYNQRFLPVMSNDALAYHVPAAVHWLQQRRLALFETWVYNPANTYSPLAGSMFIAWLLAPVGCDVFAKYVELGPLLLIALTVMSLARRLGANATTAALLAAAAAISRPFIYQTIVAKDDLFVAAFAMTALLAFTAPQKRFAAVRVGVAIGLLLATKYTAVYALPMLVLAIDAPWRARWRPSCYLRAAGVAILLAGPWYLRNFILTRNPFYPLRISVFGKSLFPWLFTAARSETLSDARQVFDVLVTSFFAPGVELAIALAAAWVIAIALKRKQLLSDALVRCVVVAPILMIVIFIVSTPYAEVRFIDAAILLLFGCPAIVCARLGQRISSAVAGAILAVALLTNGFVPESKVDFTSSAVIVSIIAGASLLVAARIPPRLVSRFATIGVCTFLAAFGMLVYVYWETYVNAVAEGPLHFWPPSYGPISTAWLSVLSNTSPDCTIAYTNTHFVHPLHGFMNTRRIVYIPTRHGVKHISDLPPIAKPLSGEKLVAAIADETYAEPDRAQWLAGIKASGASYLFIGLKNSHHPSPPPELEMARSDPAHFAAVYEDTEGEAVIYQVLGAASAVAPPGRPR